MSCAPRGRGRDTLISCAPVRLYCVVGPARGLPRPPTVLSHRTIVVCIVAPCHRPSRLRPKPACFSYPAPATAALPITIVFHRPPSAAAFSMLSSSYLRSLHISLPLHAPLFHLTSVRTPKESAITLPRFRILLRRYGRRVHYSCDALAACTRISPYVPILIFVRISFRLFFF